MGGEPDAASGRPRMGNGVVSPPFPFPHTSHEPRLTSHPREFLTCSPIPQLQELQDHLPLTNNHLPQRQGLQHHPGISNPRPPASTAGTTRPSHHLPTSTCHYDRDRRNIPAFPPCPPAATTASTGLPLHLKTSTCRDGRDRRNIPASPGGRSAAAAYMRPPASPT
jgi:hypothetical protein